MSRKKKHEQEGQLTASECLAMFDDLPDGAAMAAAADVYGKGYGEFIAALSRESEGKK